MAVKKKFRLKLKDLTDEQIEKLTVPEHLFISSKINNCMPGKPCQEVDWFDIIIKCGICGKLY